MTCICEDPFVEPLVVPIDGGDVCYDCDEWVEGV